MSAARSGPNSVTSRHGLCRTSSPTSVIRRTAPAPGLGRERRIRVDGPALYEDARHGCFSCRVLWGIRVPAFRSPSLPSVTHDNRPHTAAPEQTGRTGHTRRRFLAGAGVPGSGDGRPCAPLPAEHGFRFIPGIYHNLPDTMRRIPFPGNANGVRDNLVAPHRDVCSPAPAAVRTCASRCPGRGTQAPAPTSPSTRSADAAHCRCWTLGTGIPAHEAAYFVDRVLVFLTSCDERRDEAWETGPVVGLHPGRAR